MYSSKPIDYRPKRLQLADWAVFCLFGFVVYGTVATAQRWTGVLRPSVAIDLSYASLPLYSVYTLFRGLIAYLLSLMFTLIVGALAAKNKVAEQVIIPLLDIGQSIPVLCFLPGLVLGLIAIFPTTNLGLELACILMIFTGQVWNMVFSFYASIKSVPHYLYEMCDISGLSSFQKFIRLELPYSATGLAWNSLMSMAGGWFFITVCEAFTLDKKDFRLPGLGSYMSVAIDQGNTHAMAAGVGAMLLVIVLVDFILWRPIVAWTRKFRLDEDQDTAPEIPFVGLMLKESFLVQSALNQLYSLYTRLRPPKTEVAHSPAKKRSSYLLRKSTLLRKILKRIPKDPWQYAIMIVTFFVAVWVFGKIHDLIRPLVLRDYIWIAKGTGFTFLRVALVLVLSTLWAVPAGIVIGLSPVWTRRLQPVIQAAASFPAPMLYPIALGILAGLHIGLGLGSSFLMMLGVQWYVLFNVLAGAVGISHDLRESFRLIGVSNKEKWLKLYFPSILPQLVTGWVTAAGGAWNASIVSEYVQYKGETLETLGIGALISKATNEGNFAMLTACLVAVVLTVVTLNRVLWKRIYKIAEDRFRFER